jgi:hypothetical protein
VLTALSPTERPQLANLLRTVTAQFDE